MATGWLTAEILYCSCSRSILCGTSALVEVARGTDRVGMGKKEEEDKNVGAGKLVKAEADATQR